LKRFDNFQKVVKSFRIDAIVAVEIWQLSKSCQIFAGLKLSNLSGLMLLLR